MSKEDTKLTLTQSIVTLAVLAPLTILLSIFTWLKLYSWYIEPFTKIRLGWWYATGLGTFTYYYSNQLVTKVEVTRENWLDVWVAVIVKYAVCLLIGWACWHVGSNGGSWQ